ncbi:hypothetical protein MNV49_001639 [Pseudohyphozyma bogoriensis]|nr:hypothetical protein MNV49_001639 [Pseudohyphozyma bogoriensis]
MASYSPSDPSYRYDDPFEAQRSEDEDFVSAELHSPALSHTSSTSNRSARKPRPTPTRVVESSDSSDTDDALEKELWDDEEAVGSNGSWRNEKRGADPAAGRTSWIMNSVKKASSRGSANASGKSGGPKYKALELGANQPVVSGRNQPPSAVGSNYSGASQGSAASMRSRSSAASGGGPPPPPAPRNNRKRIAWAIGGAVVIILIVAVVVAYFLAKSRSAKEADANSGSALADNSTMGGNSSATTAAPTMTSGAGDVSELGGSTALATGSTGSAATSGSSSSSSTGSGSSSIAGLSSASLAMGSSSSASPAMGVSSSTSAGNDMGATMDLSSGLSSSSSASTAASGNMSSSFNNGAYQASATTSSWTDVYSTQTAGLPANASETQWNGQATATSTSSQAYTTSPSDAYQSSDAGAANWNGMAPTTTAFSTGSGAVNASSINAGPWTSVQTAFRASPTSDETNIIATKYLGHGPVVLSSGGFEGWSASTQPGGPEQTVSAWASVATATPTTAAPKTTSSSTGGAYSWQTYRGVGTWFESSKHKTVCDMAPTDSDFVVSLPSAMYEASISNANDTSSFCGAEVTITNAQNGLTINAWVSDECVYCSSNTSLDLSKAVFTALNPNGLSVGLIDIAWGFTMSNTTGGDTVNSTSDASIISSMMPVQTQTQQQSWDDHKSMISSMMQGFSQGTPASGGGAASATATATASFEVHGAELEKTGSDDETHSGDSSSHSGGGAFPTGTAGNGGNGMEQKLPIVNEHSSSEYPFTTFLRNRSPELWSAYVGHEFPKQMAAGTAVPAAFKHFLTQDCIYLFHFCRVFALAAYKSSNQREMKESLAVINHIVDEGACHNLYLKKLGITAEELDATPQSIIGMAYSRWLLDVAATDDLLALRVACLSCTLGYGEAGLNLKAPGGVLDYSTDNFYWPWVEQYASDEYQVTCKTVVEQIERMVAESPISEQRKLQLAKIFDEATRLEIAFWDDALAIKA